MKELMGKIISGRLYLTFIGGLVFAYAVKERILDNQATSAILTMVFISYFQRPDRTKGEQK